METIEHIVQQPAVRKHQTPLLFLHGAWHGAWCWQQWMDYFSSSGYEVHAFSLPGHGKSSLNKGHINFYTLGDYVDTLANEIEKITPKPIVIAHSLGGAILQKYIENHDLPGAVLLSSVPATGIFPMMLRFLWRHPIPVLKSLFTLNFYHIVGTPALAKDLFLNKDTQMNVVDFQQQLVGETLNSPLQTMLPFARYNSTETPVIVIGGGEDKFFTQAEQQSTARKYRARCVIIEGQAHNLMMESASQQVAGIIDQWITHDFHLDHHD